MATRNAGLETRNDAPARAAPAAGRRLAQAVASLAPAEQRPAFARAFCRRVAAAYWSALAGPDEARFPLRPLFDATGASDLDPSTALSAEIAGAALARLAPEEAAYQIGLIYTGMLPQEYRARLGVYYTPPALAQRLIERATAAGVDWARCRILDPACGGGAFLAPVAQRILDELQGCAPSVGLRNIAARLRGFEIDPFAAWLSQVALDAVVLPLCREAGRRLPVLVTVCDSLTLHRPAERFGLVIGNPPYGRVSLAARDRAVYRRSLFGHANLYGLFTDIALRHAAPGGVVAYVTPTSFLAGEYFKRLRALLGSAAPPVTIDFISARKGVFEDVLQETLLATYRRDAEPAPATVHLISPTERDAVRIEAVGSFTLPADPSQPWIVPRTAALAGLAARLRAMPHRLADWGYSVSTGPLVWNRHKPQLRDMAAPGCHPLIWAEAVTADGRFEFRARKRNHKPFFRPEPGDEWLLTRTACVLLQRTTAKEQSRRLIAAALPAAFLQRHGAVVIENHLNMLRPVVDAPPVAPAVLAAFLNSKAADQAFRCVSGSVAVSAYELEALPLPPPEALDGLRELVAARAGRDAIDAACARLYAGDADP